MSGETLSQRQLRQDTDDALCACDTATGAR